MTSTERRLIAAQAVHSSRFPPGGRKPPPWGQIGTAQRAYCFRIADGVIVALGLAS